LDYADLAPRRHKPPAGWSREVFEAVTDALAQALVANLRRQVDDEPSQDPSDGPR